MSIRQKLLAAFLVIALFVGVTGYFSLLLSDSVSGIKNIELPMEQNLREVEVSLWETVYAVNAFRLTGVTQYEQLYQRQVQDVEQFLQKYQFLVDSPEEREFINEFLTFWNQSKVTSDEVIEFTKQLIGLEKRLFKLIDDADDIIDTELQGKWLPDDPQLLAKEQAVREVEVNLWECIHAAQQYLGLSKQIVRGEHKVNEKDKNTYATAASFVKGDFKALMERQIQDVDQFWAKYQSLSTNETEKVSIKSFNGIWQEAVLTSRNLVQLNDQLNRDFETLSIIIDKADDVIDLKMQTFIEKRLVLEDAHSQQMKTLSMLVSAFTFLLAIGLGIVVSGSISNPINSLMQTASDIGKGKYDIDIKIKSKDEVGKLANTLRIMAINLKQSMENEKNLSAVAAAAAKQAEEKVLDLEKAKNEIQQQNWLKTEVARIANMAQNLQKLTSFCQKILSELAKLIEVSHAACYVQESRVEEVNGDTQEQITFNLLGSYASVRRENTQQQFIYGEGLVGQCAMEKKALLIADVPPDHITITTGVGESTPLCLLFLPVVFDDNVLAVMEFAAYHPFTPVQQELLSEISRHMGAIIRNIKAHQETELLLLQSQHLTDLMRTQQQELMQKNTLLEQSGKELQSQKEHLRRSNDQLEIQTKQLKQSKEELKQQSEELQVTNEELEEQRESLLLSKSELEKSQITLQQKAKDLDQANKYKSEFLANMSHELRTPLNSLLILSNTLATDQSLSEQQRKHAEIIHDGGNELLNLINDIMDLSKVEAGMLDIQITHVNLQDIATNMTRLFERTAQQKGISFEVLLDKDLPDTFDSDCQRVEQVLKNFLSNAFKFTKQGTVKLHLHAAPDDMVFNQQDLSSSPCLAFSVTDTGRGITAEKQKVIFEAFHQEDGSTNRQYGGTGLGLSISQELVRLLGGEIHLQSTLGKGSTFSCYLPFIWQGTPDSPADSIHGHVVDNHSTVTTRTTSTVEQDKPGIKLSETWIPDNRHQIQTGDKSLLIIEDDYRFAEILLNLAHKQRFKSLVTNQGREGILLAMEYQPRGILLDLGLPDINGLAVLEQLKFNLKTRHIPVHVITAGGDKQACLSQGAVSFINKPADEQTLIITLEQLNLNIQHQLKQVLVVEDNLNSQHSITQLLNSDNVEIVCTGSTEAACEMLLVKSFDCIILDLLLPDVSGQEALDKISALPNATQTPIIIYTGKDLSREEQQTLSRLSSSIILKGAESPDRLLDEVSLFLHKVDVSWPQYQQQTLRMLHNEGTMLNERKILLVDDDIRNVFALSGVLEKVGLEVKMAEHGQAALDSIEAERADGYSPFELILMDIMMPIMDGYQAMEEIRQLEDYAATPIIALTAKAMPGDRQKCLDAGASEYITKPIDMERLLSMLRVWLYRATEVKPGHGEIRT